MHAYVGVALVTLAINIHHRAGGRTIDFLTRLLFLSHLITLRRSHFLRIFVLWFSVEVKFFYLYFASLFTINSIHVLCEPSNEWIYDLIETISFLGNISRNKRFIRLAATVVCGDIDRQLCNIIYSAIDRGYQIQPKSVFIFLFGICGGRCVIRTVVARHTACIRVCLCRVETFATRKMWIVRTFE